MSNLVSAITEPRIEPTMPNISLKTVVSAALAATAVQSVGIASSGLRLAADQGREASEWATENPGKAVALGVAMGAGAVMVATPMAVATPLLGAVGFGANGVVAGSVAAGAQSGIGSVVAPSLFATLQSAAAGGYGVPAVAVTVQSLGGVVASSPGVISVFKKIWKQGEEDQDQEGDHGEMSEDNGEPAARL
ncbi:hypothetical protein F5Y10DRAFT_231095 [Nemania abortiva]|nr:hypothetical protein F5Y10DRAFT_231095 [Nemania abortiva]